MIIDLAMQLRIDNVWYKHR